jgi:precorrin-2 dehydrogenase/sirohydrochlorin ferrochelatase
MEGAAMLYPLNLNISGRQCAVIGGGHVAERKVRSLLEAGALVTVIAPELTAGLQKLSAAGCISWRPGAYRSGMLTPIHPLLVFCTADDEQANQLAAAEAEELGALVNAAAQPQLSDFQVPSRIQHDDFMLTVSTGGHSPAFSRLLRQQLEADYPESFGLFLERLSKIREEVRAQSGGSEAHQRFWRRVMNKHIIDLVRAGQLDQAEEEVRHGIIDAGAES